MACCGSFAGVFVLKQLRQPQWANVLHAKPRPAAGASLDYTASATYDGELQTDADVMACHLCMYYCTDEWLAETTIVPAIKKLLLL